MFPTSFHYILPFVIWVVTKLRRLERRVLKLRFQPGFDLVPTQVSDEVFTGLADGQPGSQPRSLTRF